MHLCIYEIRKSNFSGAVAKMNLLECDGNIIFNGLCNDVWGALLFSYTYFIAGFV